MPEMISLEEARELVLRNVRKLPVEKVGLLSCAGRIVAADVRSDIDVSPFAHSAMDGYALKAEDLACANSETPVKLKVLDEVAAGSVFDGEASHGECVRIMTGAPMPQMFDSVVKYEIVEVVEGDGAGGSVVSFSEPCKLGANVRQAGEEARAGETVLKAGERITPAGVGFLASCGALEVEVYRRPRVAVISIGSELVDPLEVPSYGKIRNSNGYALAACALDAGAEVDMLPIVEDSRDALAKAVLEATQDHDFVVTSGGASNGDFDFIKPVVEELGELLMTTVNMRPGKAQTFGMVNGTPVFGLPGNPAAAFCGFEMIVRPALRKMQGYMSYDRAVLKAPLTQDVRKRDPRRYFLRGSLVKQDDGSLAVVPARNQSSGLLGPIQRSNCLIVMPEGQGGKAKGDVVDCVLLDVSEDVVL